MVTISNAVASSIAKTVGCSLWQVVAASSLLKEGASVPFVARYRAHMTGGLEPAQLRSIEQAEREAAEVHKRREAIEKALRERQPPVLTETLLERLRAAVSVRQLEALYEPYKRKRDTLAARAHEVGVGPLAALLWRGGLPSDAALESGLRAASCPLAEAEQHLCHAVAELVSLDDGSRRVCDLLFEQHGLVSSTALSTASPADAAAFAHYARYEVPLRRVRPHGWLALHRGAERGALKVAVTLAGAGGSAGVTSTVLRALEQSVGGLRELPPGSRRASVLRRAVADAWSRLLSRSAAARAQRRGIEAGRAESVRVFAANLAHLLRTPPAQLSSAASRCAVLGVDPGFAHGHKCAVVDAATGSLLETTTVRAFSSGGGGGDGEEQPPPAESVEALRGLIERHAVALVAVGDGKGSALAQRAVAHALVGTDALFTVVSEAGASAFSASPLAEQQLPHVPIGERGAVSLARRVLDPLAELVQLPPSSLGVGLYQKDAKETALAAALAAAVQDAVADVGVDLNCASPQLLAQVPGLNARTASAIRARIESEGPFRSRADLLGVKGLGSRAFQNCAGFLRITPLAGAGARLPAEPLDATRVHPEAYGRARAELAAVGADVLALAAGQPLPARAAAELRARADALPQPEAAAEARALADLLCDPLLAGDPRRLIGEAPTLRSRALTLSELAAGMVCTATVRNVTPFGAFCDLGAGTDGLLHASQLPRGREDVLHVGARIRVRLLGVNVGARRISLGLETSDAPQEPAAPAQPHEARSAPSHAQAVGQRTGDAGRAGSHSAAEPAAKRPRQSGAAGPAARGGGNALGERQAPAAQATPRPRGAPSAGSSGSRKRPIDLSSVGGL